MIHIKRLILNPFQENTYIIYDQTNEAVIVDAGCYSNSGIEEVKRFIGKENLKVKCLLITHGHIDHIVGNQPLKEIYKVECLAHPDEFALIESAPLHALRFGLDIDKAPVIDKPFKDGDIITFGNSSIEIIHTPGHSMGGVCFFFREQKILITGDTLFKGSIGRTDLGGNYETLINSIINKILPLGDDIVVYPGHGDSTTIGYEKKHNPFLS
ncbi:MAG: MBL fold metallo-hydrolase [Bacteroidales bacterium]|nr:MBL fold metallo-hydrolase [Bacteroidales bacterium]